MGIRNPKYFRADLTQAKKAGSWWRAEATILRTDTDEAVEHLSVKAATPESVEQQLTAAVAQKLASLEPPKDWGKDPTVPHLIQRYLLVRDHVYGLMQPAEDAVAVAQEASKLRRKAEEYERTEMRALQEQTVALTEAQQVELATPTVEQHAQRQNPWVLDILTAKKELSQFLANPSPTVQAASQQLERVLNE